MQPVTRQHTCTLRIAAGHPALDGHFPERPIVPGVVWLELVMREAVAALGFQPAPVSWSRVRFMAPIAPETDVKLELDGDPTAFRFRLATDRIVARGQCRHEPLD